MAVPHTGCDTCAKLCDDAKENVKKLEKKIYTLTIVCTSAITLLGEQAAKSIVNTISTMSSAMSSASSVGDINLENNKLEIKNEEQKNKVSIGGWKPVQPPFKIETDKQSKEQIKKYELIDELSKIDDDSTPPQEPKVVTQKSQKINSQKVTTNNIKQELQNMNFSTNLNSTDPYSVFLTPSTLPFDVYSTTLDLGINYGFGEYYGIPNNNSSIIPNPSTFSMFALGSIFNTRRRTI